MGPLRLTRSSHDLRITSWSGVASTPSAKDDLRISAGASFGLRPRGYYGHTIG